MPTRRLNGPGHTAPRAISLRLALDAARVGLGAEISRRDGWSGLCAAADRHAAGLGLPARLWGRACQRLGRRGAALCLVLIAHGLHRPTPDRHRDNAGSLCGSGPDAGRCARHPIAPAAAMDHAQDHGWARGARRARRAGATQIRAPAAYLTALLQRADRGTLNLAAGIQALAAHPDACRPDACRSDGCNPDGSRDSFSPDGGADG
ncbi:MAG: hypothetical protein AAGD12_16000 [Pseudomonadota bacterium]